MTRRSDAKKVPVLRRRLGILTFGALLLLTFPLFAEDSSGDAAAGEGTAHGVNADEKAPEGAPSAILERLSEKIIQRNKTSYDSQVNQIAQDLQKINAEQKELTRESEKEEMLPGNSDDAEILLKSKLGLAQKKKELIELKSSFLQEKIRAQTVSHARIQYLLLHVFADDASFFLITDQLRETEKRRTARFAEKARLRREIDAIASRIQIEEKYLSAKRVILAAAHDDERAHIQETVSLAEERLQVFLEMKALFMERMNDLEFRLAAIGEVDRLIRLRRRDVAREAILSRKPRPYGLFEIVFVSFSVILSIGGLLFRRCFAEAIRSLPSYLSREVIFAWLKALWGLGLVAFFGWSIFSLLEFRAAAIVVAIVYLNVAFGFILFVIVKGVAEFLSMSLLRRNQETSHAEIKQSSSVFLLVRTVLMWGIFCGIFYEILGYWALRTEVVGWISDVLNTPFFQSQKIKISLWILVRSVLVFWLFYVGARFLNGVLRSRVYPKSSLDKNSQHAIRVTIQFACLVIGAMAGIQLLGVDLSVLTVFSGTLGIGIGFGLQEIVKNVFSGFVIFFERPIRMGDVVEVGGVPGIVRSIRTRSTIVNTFDNISIVVPNSEFLTNRVVNWSHSDRVVRVESRVGVDYGSDAGVVKETLLEIARDNPKVMSQPVPVVVFEEFADSALLFRLLYWVDMDDRMTVKSEINFAIHARFKEKGISIPFPQRDLHLKSSSLDLLKRSPGDRA